MTRLPDSEQCHTSVVLSEDMVLRRLQGGLVYLGGAFTGSFQSSVCNQQGSCSITLRSMAAHSCLDRQ